MFWPVIIGKKNRILAPGDTAPVSLTPISIAGTPSIGEIITATPGTFSGKQPIVTELQWKRDGVAIPLETGLTYTTVLADDGISLTCEETATNSLGSLPVISNSLAISDGPSCANYDMFNLNGATQYLESNGSVGLFAGSTEFSVSLFANLAGVNAGERLYSEVNSSNLSKVALFVNANNTITLLYRTGNTSGNQSFTTTNTITLNTTVHIVAVLDSANTEIAIYIDGVKESGTIAGGAVYNGSYGAPTRIGSFTALDPRLIQGSLSNYVISSTHAFTQSDVSQLLNGSSLGYFETLQAANPTLFAKVTNAYELSSRDDSANDLAGSFNFNKVAGVAADGETVQFCPYTP
jgi:hypothetical protein